MITPEGYRNALKVVQKYQKQKADDTATRKDYVGKMAWCWLDGQKDSFVFCRLLEKSSKNMVKVQAYRGEGKFDGKHYVAKIRGVFTIPMKNVMFSKNLLNDL